MHNYLWKAGLLGLAMGLMACGQAAVDSSDPGALALVAAEASDPSASGLAEDGNGEERYTGDAIGTEIERMMHRGCASRDGLDAGMVFYSVCFGADGQPLNIELTSPVYPGADEFLTTRYWFRDSGTLYAVENNTSQGHVRNVLATDGKTVIHQNERWEMETVVDAAWWQELTQSADQTLDDFHGYRDNFAQAEQAGVKGDTPIAVVKIPRTGGDFNHRWATFVVPQASTAVSAEGGAMRWYDLHLATMVALTADQFCGNPSTRGAYFNYEADGGSVFMGQYFIDCGTARELMATFGQERQISVVMEEVHATETIAQYVPRLSDAVMPQFRRQVVDFFAPDCSEHHCPGDRI